MPLAEVAQEPFSRSLDTSGGRLLIRRVPGDRLHVKLARDSVIFSAGEMAEVQVQPHLLGSAAGGRGAHGCAAVAAARTLRDPLWSNEPRTGPDSRWIRGRPAILSVKLPEAEESTICGS